MYVYIYIYAHDIWTRKGIQMQVNEALVFKYIITYKEIGRVRFTGVLCLLVLCQGLWSRRVPSNASTPTARRNRDVNSSLGPPLGRHFLRQDGGFQSIGVPLNHPFKHLIRGFSMINHDKSSISSDFPRWNHPAIGGTFMEKPSGGAGSPYRGCARCARRWSRRS